LPPAVDDACVHATDALLTSVALFAAPLRSVRAVVAAVARQAELAVVHAIDLLIRRGGALLAREVTAATKEARAALDLADDHEHHDDEDDGADADELRLLLGHGAARRAPHSREWPEWEALGALSCPRADP